MLTRVKVNTTSLSCQTGLRRKQHVKRETTRFCHQRTVDRKLMGSTQPQTCSESQGATKLKQNDEFMNKFVFIRDER